ncbi:FUSC family protein [Ferrimonas sp. SCSIO 43195]|uniref:FUSC family protein n=1 Tax=Ferrimonas sp. SCSIO 43195 TaxID=2822844 RepID=UPI002075B43B|nr:FUSC family protein [Ferrimonas sp. SCSIO 43195]USD38252.1 FUSC family protein [Ferrimonas sp. SCSIO 43195]
MSSAIRRWWFNGHVNLALRVSLAMAAWLAMAWCLDWFQLGLLSLLAIPAVFISGIDQPSAHWVHRLSWSIPLLGGSALVFGCIGLYWPVGLIPALFVGGVLFGSLAAWDELSGRLGLAALVLAAMAQVPVGIEPPWLFALAVMINCVWVVLFSDLWFRLQGDYPLRQALALSYRRLAVILASRVKWIEDPMLGERFDLPLAEQLALVRRYVGVSKSRNRLNPELHQAFMAAVDLQERLQAIPNPELSRQLFNVEDVLPSYRLWVAVTSKRLRHIADGLMTLQPLQADERLEAAEAALVAALKPLQQHQFSQLAPYFISNVQRISRLAQRVAPLYQRKMFAPDDRPDYWRQWRLHFRWRSPVFRGAVRQGILLAVTMAIVQWWQWDKGYWALLSVLLVVRGGIVDTRRRAWQRIWGTLVGLAVAALLIVAGISGNAALLLGLLLVPPTLSLIPVHHGYSCTLGTVILIMVFEYIGAQGMAVMPLRLLETVMGCSLVLLGYRYLWPQWQGGRQAQLRQQAVGQLNGYLKLVLDAFSGRDVTPVSLARARRFTYELGVALTSSFEQMQQEPNYSRHRDSAELIRIYKQTQSHLNALAPAARRGRHLPAEHSALVRQTLLDASEAVLGAFSGKGGDWSSELEANRQAMYRLTQDSEADRGSFILYQLNLIGERYQQLYAIAGAPAPDKPSRR